MSRTERILQAMVDGEERSTLYIADATRMPRATCYLHMPHLVDQGYVTVRYVDQPPPATLPRAMYRITPLGKAVIRHD